MIPLCVADARRKEKTFKEARREVQIPAQDSQAYLIVGKIWSEIQTH